MRLGAYCIIWSSDSEFKKNLWNTLAKTIRRVPIWQLLHRLADRNGISYPVAIVGGTVRDLLRKNKPNDVDIAVGGTYNELLQYLRDLFACHQSLTDNDIIGPKSVGRLFGQMKLMNMVRFENMHFFKALFHSLRFSDNPSGSRELQSDEPEPLDIALFKARRLDQASKDKPQFEFGWSYITDARSRDTTMNALYIQLFPKPLLIDPTGRGLDDVLKDLYVPVASALKDKKLLDDDLGGQLRLWRATFDGKKVKDDLDFDPPINIWEYLNKQLCDLILRDMRSDKPNDDLSTRFFSKLFSKVWKKDLSMAKARLDEFNRIVGSKLPNLPERPRNWTELSHEWAKERSMYYKQWRCEVRCEGKKPITPQLRIFILILAKRDSVAAQE
jgi:hypothetical protein